ncbi:MAG: hypothetical protein A3I32_02920 [Candidatus Yanofskybacteria bacterium RIFCSPLOWO2_02_FULL_45_10]|uniref:Bacterial bifunctional deaminase-reductase C-terminal domain-containing protein n=2 Tax=Candidatus Yanofskyibacteriota TaxID=1752733 RepID=A0A1F8G223_9BACT|nr:MAG: hypothetical protein A3F25_02085 [Candidatus Yanofskybacteria bacterium RIFCSPHIGHO2_12_FULL_45_19b]OGN32342.1 MAG: hypothetical protein A3I32_02920 [Candidatus Yanofskybacteria bacterium RIFCSPLOWO2_02_FULL_45_10]
MVTLFNVISADGFIAGKDGSENFIPDDLWPNFLNLCQEYGTLIMGRKTYDVIQSYDKNLLDQFEMLHIRKIVVSGNRNFYPKKEYVVAHSPEDAVTLAPDALVSSGPILNNFLLGSHLVKKVILHEVPTSIKEGIKPFDKDEIILIPIDKSPEIKGVKVREYRIR